MSARARRWLVVALLAVCLAAPLVDQLDRWDGGGNDVEGGVVVLALCVGFGFLFRVATAFGVPPVKLATRSAAALRTSPAVLEAVVHRAGLACTRSPLVLPLLV